MALTYESASVWTIQVAYLGGDYPWSLGGGGIVLGDGQKQRKTLTTKKDLEFLYNESGLGLNRSTSYTVSQLVQHTSLECLLETALYSALGYKDP